MKHALVCILLALLLAAPATAQVVTGVPADLEGVDITPRLGEQVPLGDLFYDEDGREVTLGTYVNGDKPVLLVLAYFECPMLCTLVMNGTVRALQNITLVPGQDFEVVLVSFDPKETPAMAGPKKRSYLKLYGSDVTADGWHFLTGSQQSIEALTDGVGFHYEWVEERQEYAHGSGIFFLTPEGKLSRFLGGIVFESLDVRLALLEAADGKIGNAAEQIILFCYHYDPTTGRYAPAAAQIMSIASGFSVLFLGAFLGFWWRRELKSKKTEEAA
jgi:protein SCO1